MHQWIHLICASLVRENRYYIKELKVIKCLKKLKFGKTEIKIIIIKIKKVIK